MSLNHNADGVLTSVLQSPKAAAIVSTSTVSSGIADILGIIPDDIGKLATLVGIVLSVVLIYTHLRKGSAEYQKIQLEIDIMRSKDEARKKQATQRINNGLPVRRGDDFK